MSTLTKSHWVSDDTDLRLDVELSKVNKERRLVSGWATLDNIDTENDVVTAEASIDAFSRAKGNLREMHKKDSAVGRIISFKQDTFVADDGNEYQGIFVTAYVSKGAQDTWEKVLDGTLSAFSIGGKIVDQEKMFNKDSGVAINKVTKYDLTELSLVDNPGNQYANIFHIQKSADSSVTTLTGMIEETNVLNVFFCNVDNIAKESPGDFLSCPICEEKMEMIGFVEEGESQKAEMKKMISGHLNLRKGGENMSDAPKTNVEVDSEKEETGTGAETPISDTQERNEEAEADQGEGNEEEGVDVEEVQAEGSQEEIVKQIDALKNSISKILSENNKTTSEKMEALEKSLDDTKAFLDKRVEKLEGQLEGLNTNLETAKSRLSNFEKKLDKVNSSSAFRKSIDSSDSVGTEQETETSMWGGAFSDPRGAFSVDELR